MLFQVVVKNSCCNSDNAACSWFESKYFQRYRNTLFQTANMCSTWPLVRIWAWLYHLCSVVSGCKYLKKGMHWGKGVYWSLTGCICLLIAYFCFHFNLFSFYSIYWFILLSWFCVLTVYFVPPPASKQNLILTYVFGPKENNDCHHMQQTGWTHLLGITWLMCEVPPPQNAYTVSEDLW